MRLTSKILYLCLLWAPFCAQAHEVGMSLLTLDLKTPTQVTYALAPIDAAHFYKLDLDGDEEVSRAEFEQQKQGFAQAVADVIELTLDGKRISPSLISSEMPDDTTLVVRWQAPLGTGTLRVRSEIIHSFKELHRFLISLRKDDKPTVSGFISRNEPEREFQIDGLGATTVGAGGSGAKVFFISGMEHIFTGWDHMLFVLALLMTGTSLRAIVKIITAFTITHSLTLALAILGFLSISPRIIEPLVALSIVYVALENLRSPPDSRRWKVAAVFGLIHGCGFASAAVELFGTYSQWQKFFPLAMFNLGIEFGQVVIAALCLPLVWKLKKYPAYDRRILPMGSIAIAGMGLYWFVERALGQQH